MKPINITIHTPERLLSFEAAQEMTLLDVMHELQLPVRKACRNGACGVCRCQLVAGDITYKQREPFALWQADIEAGVILPCIAYAASDVTIGDISFQLKKK